MYLPVEGSCVVVSAGFGRAVWIQGPSYYSDGLGPSTTLLLTPSHHCFVPTVDPIRACLDPA